MLLYPIVQGLFLNWVTTAPSGTLVSHLPILSSAIAPPLFQLHHHLITTFFFTIHENRAFFQYYHNPSYLCSNVLIVKTLQQSASSLNRIIASTIRGYGILIISVILVAKVHSRSVDPHKNRRNYLITRSI